MIAVAKGLTRADALAASMAKGERSRTLSPKQVNYLMDVAEQCGNISWHNEMHRTGGGYAGTCKRVAAGFLADEDGPVALWKMIPGRWGAYLVVSPTPWQRTD